MTNEQLYLAIGVPLVVNLVLVMFIHNSLKSLMQAGFTAVNTRFDDMRTLWLSELHRVEEVLDARVKSIEEKVK